MLYPHPYRSKRFMQSTKNSALLFIGTYTRLEPHLVTANGKGIYTYRLDLDSGELTYLSEVHGIVNPSFLTIGPEQRYLYAVSEIDQTEDGGVSAYAIDQASGALSHINTQQAGGSSACYISVDQTGRLAITSNYMSGNIGMFAIRPDGGIDAAHQFMQQEGTGPNRDRQEGPHAHCLVIDPTNRYAFSADLGADKIFGYKIDFEAEQLILHHELKLEPGSGPRHLVFHPNGNNAYLIQELDSTITALSYDSENGMLQMIETVSTLPVGFEGLSHCADIHVTPNGKFLYGSNRGHDSIVIYAIDKATGKLSLVGHEPARGEIPRNFAIDPTGTYLLVANQNSDNIVTFRIDQETGQLEPTGHVVRAPTPVCLKMVLA